MIMTFEVAIIDYGCVVHNKGPDKDGCYVTHNAVSIGYFNYSVHGVKYSFVHYRLKKIEFEMKRHKKLYDRFRSFNTVKCGRLVSIVFFFFTSIFILIWICWWQMKIKCVICTVYSVQTKKKRYQSVELTIRGIIGIAATTTKAYICIFMDFMPLTDVFDSIFIVLGLIKSIL